MRISIVGKCSTAILRKHGVNYFQNDGLGSYLT